MGAPPSTPATRKFLVPKRSTQQPDQATPASTAHKFFTSTPRLGGSTQRGIEDVEDVDSEEDEDEEEEQVNGSQVVKESFEVNDDGDEVVPDSIDVGDDLEVIPDSIEQHDTNSSEFDLSDTSPEKRHVKRRRLSQDDADVRGDTAKATVAGQPVFRPPPRFKQAPEEEGDAAHISLPNVFSPQRKGTKYIAGGLAAELQGWLSDVKNQDSGPADQLRFTVEQVKLGVRMYLVSGMVDGEKKKVVLAGEGKLNGLGKRPVVTEGSRVALGQLGWDIVLEGEKWHVACDWTLL